MTTGRVTVDVARNEPLDFDAVASALKPLVELVGIDYGDVIAVHIDPRKSIRFKVRTRNRRGRILPDSWAHVVVRIDLDPDRVEE
jgi:hypothetical protein